MVGIGFAGLGEALFREGNQNVPAGDRAEIEASRLRFIHRSLAGGLKIRGPGKRAGMA
jgi:hypothetical protein